MKKYLIIVKSFAGLIICLSHLGYSTQTLVDFEPKDLDVTYHYNYFPGSIYREIVYDMRGESNVGFFHITPGLSFNLEEQLRLLLGVRFYLINELENASTKNFILPMIQVDFSL